MLFKVHTMWSTMPLSGTVDEIIHSFSWNQWPPLIDLSFAILNHMCESTRHAVHHCLCLVSICFHCHDGDGCPLLALFAAVLGQ